MKGGKLVHDIDFFPDCRYKSGICNWDEGGEGAESGTQSQLSGAIIITEKDYARNNILAANHLKIHGVAKGEIHAG